MAQMNDNAGSGLLKKRAADTNSDEKPKQIVSTLIEQRKSSQRYYSENYYSEFAEIYRNLNARTKPHQVWNGTDQKWEDDTSGRTNVCVPDHFVMQRRGVSRLTRNPPNLRVRGGPDTDIGQQARDKVSAKLMFNWDRSESQRAFKRIVASSYCFGIGIGKTYYDEVPVIRRLRRLTTTLQPGDFKNLTKSFDPAINAVMKQFGPRLQDNTPLSEEEMAMMVSTLGDEVSLNVSTMKYKGPTLDAVFTGDFFPEPGFKSLAQSGYIIENSNRDEEWLEYWLAQTSIDPRTGESKPVLDLKACQKALDKAGTRTTLDNREMNLRRWMRDAIELADPLTSGQSIKAPKKRFMVDERHSFIDGHLAIDFVADESNYLGRLWYPWDTYGRYQYSEMILIPDLLGGIGMSTLRVTRWLLMLRNARLNQTTDFINNKLLPLLLKRAGGDQTAYDLVRTEFARVVEVQNMADYKFADDPNFPREAWEDQQQYKQDMQNSDPTTADFSAGSATNALSGKLATTAALQAKSTDTVVADTLDQIGQFVRDVVELELWMDQQAMDEDTKVPSDYFKRINSPLAQPENVDQTTAVSIRTQGGQARFIDVSPMDMQEDYEILPEQGSTLASDDQFRVAALQQFAAIGAQHPDIVNMRAVITKLAEASPGINPEEVILPPPPPQKTGPEMRVSVSITAKFEDLPPDVQAAILEKEGLPTDLTHVIGAAKVIQHASQAADAATNLEAPAKYDTPVNGKPNGKPVKTPSATQ